MRNALKERKEKNKASTSAATANNINARKRKMRGISTPEDKANEKASAPAGMKPAEIEKKEDNTLQKSMLYKMDSMAYKMEDSSPIVKHSGIGPANLGGPGMKSHVHACGTPKRSSGLNDGHSPMEFNDKLEKAVDDGKITGEFAEAVKGGMPKMEAGSITMKPESDVEKYRKLDIEKS